MNSFKINFQILIIAFLVALSVASCAPKETPQNSDTDSAKSSETETRKELKDKDVTDDQKATTQVSEKYEPYPVFKASELLEQELLRREHHDVVEEVRND